MKKTRATEPSDERPQKAGASISEHRLRNGLRILVAERHLDPVVAVMVWYGVGARNEREEEAGLSHFLEHMMFKGSAHFGKGEVDRMTTALGGSNNAHTGYDHTAYWFELASDRWECALEVEADRMQQLLLDEREFEAEKAVVLEELAMGKDDPWTNLSQQVSEMLYPRHPYRRPIIGYADVLGRAGTREMRDYYQRFYHPGNAILVVAGDVTPKRVVAQARKHFGAIAKGPAYAAIDRPRPEIVEPRGERRLTTHWDDAAARLVMAWPTASVGSEDDDVLDVLSGLCTNGRLSRLYRRLVLDEGLATYVGTSNDTRIESGSFWLYAEAVAGVEPARLEAAIDEELARLRTKAPTAAELKRVRALLGSAEDFEGETVSDLAESLGSFAIDADWRLAVGARERRRKVSGAKLRSLCARYLTPERRVVGWSLPQSGVALIADNGATR